MKNTGKSHKSGGNTKSGGEPRKDRKSGSGMSGSPKKGGHGGKFTWVGDGDFIQGMDRVVAVDSKDPNFEDPNEDSLSV